MEGSCGRAGSGFGSLASDLLQRIYTQPVLKVEDRLRGLAVCKWWAYSLAELPFSSLSISDWSWPRRPENIQRCQKQLLWAISTQPAIVDLQLDLSGSKIDPELASLALHSINRQALRKLRCTLSAGLRLPCPTIFPGLQSLSYPTLPLAVGPGWARHLPRLTCLTYLHFHVTTRTVPQAEPGAGPGAGPGGHSMMLPSAPSLCELSLELDESCSFEFGGDMPALRRLNVNVDGNINLSSAGTRLSQLERLCLSGAGRVQVDFALLPSLQEAQLTSESELELHGAATVRQAASLTQLGFSSGATGENLDEPWMLELVESAPPCLRRLEVVGVQHKELAEAMAGLQHLHTLVIDSGEGNAELPPGPLWNELQILCWASLMPLPLAVRGAPQLHTVVTPLWDFRDLKLLLSLPSLEHLTILKHIEQEQLRAGHPEEDWQDSVNHVLVPRALPSLKSLKFTTVDFRDWDSCTALDCPADV